MIITTQYNYAVYSITRDCGLLSCGNTFFPPFFVARCHMFDSQADDVCQVYVLSSVHSVLALAQMCKPAEGKHKR